jgi:hypothetical protein
MTSRSELQTEQVEIDREILDALVAATPEKWQAAILELEFQTDGAERGVTHAISNPDGATDTVEATEELFIATRKLDLLFRRFSIEVKRARYEAREKEPGRWHLHATFEYAEPECERSDGV